MRAGIHPNYKKVKVICTSCGNEFETGSVLDEIRVDTCSNCHSTLVNRDLRVLMVELKNSIRNTVLNKTQEPVLQVLFFM